MKRILCVWMLLTGIAANLCAQTNRSDKAFEVPENIVFNRKFYINLDKGNKLTIELTDINDLKAVGNIDSLLQVFLMDIDQLKDSLADPLTSKRIDYVTDAQGRKKIRFQQFQPKGATFLLNKGDLASLRTEQDTVSIIGVIANPPKAEQKISLTNPRYYHFTFLLNNFSELSSYMNGALKEKITTIQAHVNDKWPLILGGSDHSMQADKNIYAERPKGFTQASIGDFINGYITVNMQNYKSYFVPSFSVGARFVFSNRDRTFKKEVALLWEPHFLFPTDSLGKMQTYRNDFLTLEYGQGGMKDHNPFKEFSFSTVFSFGYLIRRDGDIMAKNTFRIGAGKLKFYKTSIEPSMYFNDLFKDVTPSIRITQSF